MRQHCKSAIYSIYVAYETRLTANSKPPKPKHVRTCMFVSAVYLRRKLTVTPVIFVLSTTSFSVQVILVVVFESRKAIPVFW